MDSSFNLIPFVKQIIEDQVAVIFNKELSKKFNKESIEFSVPCKFEFPPDETMGHIALACFSFAKILKNSPVIISKQLEEQWNMETYFTQVQAVGPYLNFFISSKFMFQFLEKKIQTKGDFGRNSIGKGKKVMLEYSSPNTNKPLHLGHGRNNLLGISLSHLLTYSGFEVIKVNLINDRGIHICKSMLAYQKWGNETTPEDVEKKGDQFVGDYYVLYNQKLKHFPEIEQEAQQMLIDWENNDPNTKKLWQKMNQWVLSGFDTTYKRMGISFDHIYFESNTYSKGREIVEKNLEQGICKLEENNAISIDLKECKLGKKILLRGDGTTVYITQDIYTTIQKFKDYNLDACLFVVGNEQENHFQILFKTLEKFGYAWSNKCEHISYGMITLPEGKMKSREGTTVDLDYLMDELYTLALEGLLEREKKQPTGRSKEQLKNTAEAIGQAAIKFYILRTNATKNILFNPKESLSFEGATGPYLQYTYARMCSLSKKANTVIQERLETNLIETYLFNQEETRILFQLSKFPDTIQHATTERNPAMIANYTYDLAKAFNQFYYEHTILKLEDKQTQQIRLKLCNLTQQVLKQNLHILGIKPLEQM